jgi:hypothetical protein
MRLFPASDLRCWNLPREARRSRLGLSTARAGHLAVTLILIAAFTGCDLLTEVQDDPADEPDCPFVPDGQFAYIHLEEGREFRFDYYERDLREQQPEAPITRRTWTGDLSWKVENIRCQEDRIDFTIRERFEGQFLFEGWAPCAECEVTVIEDGPHQWEKTLASSVRDNRLHIPGYLQSTSEMVSTSDRRLSLEWLHPIGSPDSLSVSATLFAGFGSHGSGDITVARDVGITDYRYSSSYRAMMYASSGRLVELKAKTGQ